MTNPEPTTESAPETPAEGATPKNGNREARYRTERNDARAERDALAARIATYQTRELERTAGKHLAAPGDLLALSGKTLAEFLTEDGDVDADAIEAAALEIVNTRPGLAVRQRATDTTQGHGNSGPVKRAPTFGDLLLNS
ncbi:hypothetical protein ACFYY5_01335 [Nocardia elegans]|uniref:Uncharacterized protein n=1 Tax=Nocardia elegans TaxID=300029 RepID=A0ABW6T8B8_9NOCA